MGVDETSLDRIRNATFPSSRRGYDKREVQRFLARLADWLDTGGGGESSSDTVKRELERVGERTGAVLAQAEESARQIRAEAEEEAQATIAEAQEKARRIVDEGSRRRQDLESVIADLVLRRDDVLSDTEALTEMLTQTLLEHRPAGQDPFAEPADFDPLEGEGEDEPFDADGDLDAEEGEEYAEEEDGAEAEPTEVEDAADAAEAQETEEHEAAKPPPEARRSRSSKVKA